MPTIVVLCKAEKKLVVHYQCTWNYSDVFTSLVPRLHPLARKCAQAGHKTSFTPHQKEKYNGKQRCAHNTQYCCDNYSLVFCGLQLCIYTASAWWKAWHRLGNNAIYRRNTWPRVILQQSQINMKKWQVSALHLTITWLHSVAAGVGVFGRGVYMCWQCHDLIGDRLLLPYTRMISTVDSAYILLQACAHNDVMHLSTLCPTSPHQRGVGISVGIWPLFTEFLSQIAPGTPVMDWNTYTEEYSIRKNQMPHGWGQSYQSNPTPYPHLTLVEGGGA